MRNRTGIENSIPKSKNRFLPSTTRAAVDAYFLTHDGEIEANKLIKRKEGK